MAYSPDGLMFVSGSSDNSLMLWDAGTGNCHIWPDRIGENCASQRLVGHEGQVLSVGFSPDGSRIFSASEDMTIRIGMQALVNW